MIWSEHLFGARAAAFVYATLTDFYCLHHIQLITNNETKLSFCQQFGAIMRSEVNTFRELWQFSNRKAAQRDRKESESAEAIFSSADVRTINQRFAKALSVRKGFQRTSSFHLETFFILFVEKEHPFFAGLKLGKADRKKRRGKRGGDSVWNELSFIFSFNIQGLPTLSASPNYRRQLYGCWLKFNCS